MKASFRLINSSIILMKWWKTWRTLPILSWVKAASFYRIGKFERAAHYYLKGLELHANHPAALCARLDLAYCLFRIRRLEEAEQHLKFVVARMRNPREAFLRLARIQLWGGRSLEAAWTLRRATRKFPQDQELLAYLIIACLDHGGPAYLLSEARKSIRTIPTNTLENPKLLAAIARMNVIHGSLEKGRTDLEALSLQEKICVETLMLFSETLLEEGKISHARLELRRALALEPNHPRILSLLAEAYLRSGNHYSPEYALQLATSACQNSNWLSAREMHVLAETYYHSDDSVSALIMAHKAKQAGSQLLGEYRNIKNLERLIENLSSTETLWQRSKVL